MGVLRGSPEGLIPFLNPPAGFTTESGDRYVFLAEHYENTLPGAGVSSGPLERGRSMGGEPAQTSRSVLILGWNRKVPTLLSEFESYRGERFDIDIISLLPIPERMEQLARFGNRLETVRVNQVYGDYTALRDLLDLHPAGYDNILLLSSDRLDSGEESDARTIFGFVLLRDILSREARQPEIIVELMDPENAGLFEKRTGEVIISPLILSHILAHVALRPELLAVFEELFTTGGAELYFRPAPAYGIAPGDHRFENIQNCVQRRGDTALGIRRGHPDQKSGGGIILNPNGETIFNLGESDEIVVLTTYT